MLGCKYLINSAKFVSQNWYCNFSFLDFNCIIIDSIWTYFKLLEPRVATFILNTGP